MITRPDLFSIAETLKEIPFPSRFAVELCADCDLNCTMCYHDQMVRPKGVMPYPLWQKCADEIAEVDPRTEVWFSFCGEPLLEPELLLRMLAYGRRVGLQSLSLNTNGMKLTHEYAVPLVESGLKRIVIGVDGFSRQTYENIRVGGDRDELYSNIEYLLEVRKTHDSGPEIMTQYIVMDENEHELDAFVEYWLKKGATAKVRNKLSWGGRIGTPMDISSDDRIPCPWAITMMHVFWDGRVPRCPGDTEGEEGVGNLWHDSVTALWNRLGHYRKLHLRHEFQKLPERCRVCKDWMVGIADRIRHTGNGSLDTSQGAE